MTTGTRVRNALRAIAVGLLLLFAWNGVVGGIGQVSSSLTVGQWVETAVQLAYGIFAALCVLTSFAVRRWAPLAQTGWVVTASTAGGLASVVWGDASVTVGLASGAASILITVGIVWLLRAGARVRAAS